MGNRDRLDPDLVSARENEAFNRPDVGPSDSSDSAADLIGTGLGTDENSDRAGTGEHPTAGEEPDIRDANDIAPDRIVGAEEVGLGGGLDEAEEAQLGITDEEIARGSRH